MNEKKSKSFKSISESAHKYNPLKLGNTKIKNFIFSKICLIRTIKIYNKLIITKLIVKQSLNRAKSKFLIYFILVLIAIWLIEKKFILWTQFYYFIFCWFSFFLMANRNISYNLSLLITALDLSIILRLWHLTEK